MTELPTFCHNCGCNLVAERPVEVGALTFDPRGKALWHGRTVRLTVGQHLILAALVGARGALVRADILAERIGYDGDNNVVDVLLHRVRRALTAAGAPATLIGNVRGRGYFIDLGLARDCAGSERQAARC